MTAKQEDKKTMCDTKFVTVNQLGLKSSIAGSKIYSIVKFAFALLSQVGNSQYIILKQ